MDEQYHASPHIHRRSFDCAAGAVMASSAPQWLPGSAFAGISSEKGSVISCFGAIFRSGYAGFNHAFREFVASSRSTVACPSSSWGPISKPSRCTGKSASVPFQNLKELSIWSPGEAVISIRVGLTATGSGAARAEGTTKNGKDTTKARDPATQEKAATRIIRLGM